MARRPRVRFPGAIYHVMSRGNRKGAIVVTDDDRRHFLDLVWGTAKRYGVECLAYCLMSNHYHLVLGTPRANLSDAMQQINGRFTQGMNRRHRWTGHLFEGRFQAVVVGDDEYLRTVVRYVVLNPVTAGLVKDASSWKWSSYRATAGFEPAPPGLCLGWLERTFGGNSLDEAQLRFRLFVNDDLGRAQIERIPTDASLVLGSASLEEKLRQVSGADDVRVRAPIVVRGLARPTLLELFGEAPLPRSQRNARMYEAHVRYGYRLAEIATFLGLHPTTVSVSVRRHGSVSL